MLPHLTNLQLTLGAFALIVVAIGAFIALAAYLDGRERRTPPFLNYFCTQFDHDQFLQDPPHQDSFAGPNEWLDHTQARRQAYEARIETPQGNELE
jgi:hypothetical protein